MEVQDQAPIIARITNPTNRALAVWQDHVKPWATGVFVTVFFIISLFESFVYVSKYLQDPISTNVMLEKVDAKDSPWITICPSPGFNTTHVAQFLPGSRAAQKLTKMFPPSLKHLHFGQYLTRKNLTFQELLKQGKVFQPLWLYLENCQAVHRIADDEQADGQMPKSSHCNFPTDVSRLQLRFDTNKPLEHETMAGVWETELVSPIPGASFVCSTLKTNFSMNPDHFSLLYMRFREPGLTDSPETKNFSHGSDNKPPSTFLVYFTQPWEKPGQHVHYTNSRPVTLFPLRMGQKWFLEFNHEKYTFLSNAKGQKCLPEEADVKESENCWNVCFESLYMANESACRFPAFRNYSSHLLANLLPEVPRMPNVCQSGKQILGLNGFIVKSNGRRYMEQCKRKCGVSCVLRKYDWLVTEEDAAAPSWSSTEDGKNHGVMVLRIMATDTHAKSVMQELSYDFHQMLGELGGAWGLFLGLSFSTVLGYVECIVVAVLNHVTLKADTC